MKKADELSQHRGFGPVRQPVGRSARTACSTLWIVFKWCDDGVFEFQGVFDTEKKAISACVEKNFCICPAKLNKRMPTKRVKWEGAWYPRLQARPSNAGGERRPAHKETP